MTWPEALVEVAQSASIAAVVWALAWAAVRLLANRTFEFYPPKEKEDDTS